MRATFWLKETPINISEELRRIAKKTGKSMSQVICEAIIKYGEKVK